MKYFFIIFLLSISAKMFSQSSPEKIVQQQLDAYNRQDLKAFIATYHDSIEVYSFNTRSLIYREKLTSKKNMKDFLKMRLKIMLQ